MRKYNLLLLLLSLFATSSFAQLVNNGGTITIQQGATLIVESDITNTTGTITNNGTIEVEGDFTNDATVTSAVGSKVIFKGATDSNFEGGTSTYAIVENDKTAGKVILTESITVNEAVDFSGGTSNIDLGNFNFTLTEAATSNGTAATGWYVTEGSGSLVKEVSAGATTTFDVGDAMIFSPVDVTHSGTYAAGATVRANVTDAVHPNKPADAESHLTRYWTVLNTGITTPSMAMTGTFDDTGDVVGDIAKIKGARYEGSTWEYATGEATATTVSGTSTAATSDLSGTNFFGKANFTVFLQGPYNTTNSNMDVSIYNSAIPLTSPYAAAPATATAVPANAIDWVLVEVRDAGNLTTPVSSKSGFLLADGSIIDADGSSLLSLKDASNTSHLAILHRNHLGIMSANPIANFETTTPSVDFGTGATAVYTSGPDALQLMSDNNYALFSGDGNSNGDVAATDLVNVWIPNNGQTITTVNYLTAGLADFNLNGDVTATDFVNFWIINNSKISQIPN